MQQHWTPNFYREGVGFSERILCCPWASVNRPEYPPRRGLLLLRHIATNALYNSQKTKAEVLNLSSMTTGLAYAIECSLF